MRVPLPDSASLAVQAQWALHGKAPDAAGYKVLACSTGELDQGNFTEALGRFSLGALETLPQVSVSYLQPATRPGDSYLALAVHWFAVAGQRYASGVAPLDENGRQTAFTSYFCAPYRQLAEHAVSYLDLYAAVGAVTLPGRDGPPEPVVIRPSMPQVPAIDETEKRAAALLLTGVPVCVLGAEDTSTRERLAFIDTVMALLPYGFRSRMTAATWTKATNRDHKFRLFFSSAPRSAAQPDHILHWDDPDQSHYLTGTAHDYIDTLDEKLSSVSRLREVTQELRFGAKSAIQALELLAGTRYRAPRRTLALPTAAGRDPAAATPAPAPAAVSATGRGRHAGTPKAAPATMVRPDPDPNEKALRDCADYIEAGHGTALRSPVKWLESQARTAALDDRRRQKYRALITRYQLLEPHPELKRQEGELYAALLALAFERPLGYPAYCEVEKCLGGEPGAGPHPALLRAIERGGLADQLTTAIVLDRLDPDELKQWLRSGRVDVTQLVTLLGGTWVYPGHAQVVCDVTLAYLRLCPQSYDPGELRKVLRQHGFLAQALYLRHPEKEQYQFYALHQFLLAAYPQGLDRTAILEILTGGNSPPPTAALFAAVLKLLSVPGEWQLACKAYLHGSATLLDVDPATAAQLRDRVPELLLSEPLAGR